jgi:cyclase
MEKKMFLDASFVIFANAKKLRDNPTNAEATLWTYLKQKQSGYKFRRQHPLSTFIADFYCHELKLIIEVDGGIHKETSVAKYDADRQKYLEDMGISFLRFTNEEVEINISTVIQKIETHIINSPLYKTSNKGKPF